MSGFMRGGADQLRAALAAVAGAAMIGYPNDGTAVTVDSALDLMYYGVINIRNPKYAGGAKGDGVTNDTAAIQAALAAGEGKYVFVPPSPSPYMTTDAVDILDGTTFHGAGADSIIKSITLVNGGTGDGHRQINADGVSGFRIMDITFDASTMTGFAAGMRCIYLNDCANFYIERNRFKTPGAATAALNCSNYWITENHIECLSSDGLTYHDGVVDQWAGSHSFHINDNTVYGNGLGRYLILATGHTTLEAAAPMYDFEIRGNTLKGAQINGIWVNGRTGINHDFQVSNNRIIGVTDYFGIAISDCYDFAVCDNIIRDTGRNGIRLYAEGGFGGYACKDGIVSGNVVKNANVQAVVDDSDGSAIVIYDNCTDLVIADNMVRGAGHRYAVLLAGAVTDCDVEGSSYDAGNQGTIANTQATNRIAYGQTYTPTLTGTANVAATTARLCRWQRTGNIVSVTGRADVTPTAAGATATTVGISLPVASGLADNTAHLSGVGATQFGTVAAVVADVANDRATLQFPASGVGVQVVYFTFQYTVL